MDGLSQAFEHGFSHHVSFTYEVRLRRYDDTFRWVLVNATPRFDAEGNYSGHIGIGLDITDRKQIELSVRESESRFRVLADASPICIRLADAEGQATYWNTAWYEFTGMSKRDSLNDGWINAIHPEDRERIRALWKSAHEQREKTSYEYRLRRHDGAYHWVWAIITPRYLENGDYIGSVASVIDIEHRKQLEDRLRRIINSDIIGISFWRKAGAVFDANDAYLNLIGRTRDDLEQGQINWYDYTPPEFLPMDDQALDTMRREGRCPPYEKQYIHSDGRRIDVLVGVAFLDQSVEEGVAFVLDITERKRAEQALLKHKFELQQLNEQLLQNNRDLKDFAYIASHDLQEPLRKIVTFSNRLMTRTDEPLSEWARDNLIRIEKSAKRLHSLIQGLLSFSRLTTSPQQLGEVSLNHIVEEVITDLELQIQELNATITVDPLPSMLAEPLLIGQLFQNLLHNALKFHKPGIAPVITIRSEEYDGDELASPLFLPHAKPHYCRIVVEDNGIGFNERHKDTIFKIFQRLNVTAAYTGSGIGLAICKKIVERHCGMIYAESEEGIGSRFHVILPVNLSAPMMPLLETAAIV